MSSQQAFAWLAPELRQPLLDQLHGPMPRGREELAYRVRPKHLDRALVDGRLHVVMNSYYLQPAVCKKALALRQTGRYHLTFIGCCIREEQRPELFFDEYYEAHDYLEMYELLSNARVHALSAVIQPLLNGACVVEARLRHGTPALIDINDSLYYMRTDPHAPDCRAEREILERATSFLHKMPAWAVGEMRAAWGLARPDFLVHSLPVREYFTECAALTPGLPASLVFAGGIVPYRIASTRGHENHIMDPLIETICGAGLGLGFVVNQNARNMFWDEHAHYIDFQRQYPRFSFEPGVPFFELPGKISRHNFAVYWENVRASTYNSKHFAINMATKVFSYLEAGLPVIVHTEAPYIREFTADAGCGLVYELDRMDLIPDLVASCDHEALRAGVRAFRETHDNSGAVGPLEAAFAA
ncbi:MAG: hypothetical protein KKA55_00820 [Proteobacteria bacterium]|nr:hypothetical protein [Pseudomonadota bacterium]MBU1594059.1 hypothetical protein [Pseudomonadota bacterium]